MIDIMIESLKAATEYATKEAPVPAGTSEDEDREIWIAMVKAFIAGVRHAKNDT